MLAYINDFLKSTSQVQFVKYKEGFNTHFWQGNYTPATQIWGQCFTPICEDTCTWKNSPTKSRMSDFESQIVVRPVYSEVSAQMQTHVL